MAAYWVVGGEYTDTGFETPVEGGERRLGPYPTHGEAMAEWRRLAWATVDSAHVRYRIEEESAAPMRFWVVGGAYGDTRFEALAEGAERWHGPFESYERAQAEWRRLAWASVDDALVRYRIERLAGDPK